ncbi:LOW QUALITY PROTEIN: hypothetical protein AAY473_013793 [Plecturocebus cupreus]
MLNAIHYWALKDCAWWKVFSGQFQLPVKECPQGQTQWLMPVILALWEAKEDGFSPGIRDQPRQHKETLFLQRNKKLARCRGMHFWSQLLRRLRMEGLMVQALQLSCLDFTPCATADNYNLTLSTKLECSGAIMAHCNLEHLDSCNSLISIFLVVTTGIAALKEDIST